MAELVYPRSYQKCNQCSSWVIDFFAKLFYFFSTSKLSHRQLCLGTWKYFFWAKGILTGDIFQNHSSCLALFVVYYLVICSNLKLLGFIMKTSQISGCFSIYISQVNLCGSVCKYILFPLSPHSMFFYSFGLGLNFTLPIKFQLVTVVNISSTPDFQYFLPSYPSPFLFKFG